MDRCSLPAWQRRFRVGAGPGLVSGSCEMLGPGLLLKRVFRVRAPARVSRSPSASPHPVGGPNLRIQGAGASGGSQTERCQALGIGLQPHPGLPLAGPSPAEDPPSVARGCGLHGCSDEHLMYVRARPAKASACSAAPLATQRACRRRFSRLLQSQPRQISTPPNSRDVLRRP